jgi:hypothetical protein
MVRPGAGGRSLAVRDKANPAQAAVSFRSAVGDLSYGQIHGVALDFFNVAIDDLRCWGRDSCCHGILLAMLPSRRHLFSRRTCMNLMLQ